MAKVAYKISDLIGGAGGGGGGLTPTAISVSATVTSGKHYLVNTSGGAFTVTLPAGSIGAALKFTDAAGTWATNPLTIATTQSIDSQVTADPLICDVNFGWVEISWNGTKWITTTQNLVNVPAATAATAGTLKAYQEIPWTPTIAVAGNMIGPSPVFNASATQIGNIVFWQLRISNILSPASSGGVLAAMTFTMPTVQKGPTDIFTGAGMARTISSNLYAPLFVLDNSDSTNNIAYVGWYIQSSSAQHVLELSGQYTI